MTAYVPQILEAILEIEDGFEAGSVAADTRLQEDLGFDSGSFIELFLILEETVDGFTLGSSRLEPEDFETPAKLSAFIDRRLNELESAA